MLQSALQRVEQGYGLPHQSVLHAPTGNREKLHVAEYPNPSPQWQLQWLMSPGVQSPLAQLSNIKNHSALDTSSSQARLPVRDDRVGMVNVGAAVKHLGCQQSAGRWQGIGQDQCQ